VRPSDEKKRTIGPLFLFRKNKKARLPSELISGKRDNNQVASRENGSRAEGGGGKGNKKSLFFEGKR